MILIFIKVCDADEIAGCQDATACNYNSTATDDIVLVCNRIDDMFWRDRWDRIRVVDNDSDDDGVIQSFVQIRDHHHFVKMKQDVTIM